MDAAERTDVAFMELSREFKPWRNGAFEFEVTALDRSSTALMVDLRVKKAGEIWLDDRIWLGNPALLTNDGIYKNYREYAVPESDNLELFTDEEFREFTRGDQQHYKPTGRLVTRDSFKPDPTLAVKRTLEDVLKIVTARGPRLERIGKTDSFRGDTLAQRAATTDGSVNSSNATFATMAAGSGLAANTTNASVFTRWHLFLGSYSGRMIFLEFDTSTIGSSSTITGCVYTLYAQGTAENDSDGYNLEIRYKDWGGSVTTADWFDPRAGVWNALPDGGLLDVGSWVQTSNTANDLSDSGVYTSIDKTSLTRVVVGLSGMNASTPTGTNSIDFRAADTAGTSTDPLGTYTYSTVSRVSHLPLLGVR